MKFACFIGTLVLVTLIAGASASRADNTVPPSSTDKAAATPNFYQLDNRLPRDGRGLCAPTAASDILMYLAYHGYPKLLPSPNEDPIQAQMDMIRTLGSPSFMNTDQQGNTLPGEVLRGVWHYIQQAGYVCEGAKYVGWYPVGPAIKSYWTGTKPDLDAIKSAESDPNGIVLLMLGAYGPGSAPGQAVRLSGHMVAVVGYGSRGGNVDDPNALVIHNPGVPPNLAPVHVDDIATNYVTLTPIPSGQLTGKALGLPCDAAAGYYSIAGPGIPKRANSPYFTIVDGVVILKIGKPATAATTSAK